jgi:hypothetical protein
LAVLTALVFALAMALGTFASAASAQEETGVCHVPPGNPENAHWIPADDPSHDDHVANHPGDIPGVTEEECEGVTTTTTTTGTGTTTTGPPPTTTTTTGPPPTEPPTVVTQPPEVIVKKKPHVVVKKKGVVVAKGTATPTATVTAKATATPTAKTVTATATPTAKTVTATVTAKAAKAQYAQYKQYATATALPPTGGGYGSVLPIAVGALLLVLGSGIMVLRMARSSS